VVFESPCAPVSRSDEDARLEAGHGFCAVVGGGGGGGTVRSLSPPSHALAKTPRVMRRRSKGSLLDAGRFIPMALYISITGM
jgi:hypothetical protein